MKLRAYVCKSQLNSRNRQTGSGLATISGVKRKHKLNDGKSNKTITRTSARKTISLESNTKSET